ncbi:hypothetical protein Bca4012_036036 [Brassica carinata]|uniref:Uncharacterized protein n=1 Tax=Brassica carinata TaxID=52824 RepID=A0A8X8BA88_BRACI|nr:hypothetical protein Bca52824_009811 [Brassica carinata]
MGNCATKPKVLKDTDEDLIPVERETTAPTDDNNHPVEKSVINTPSAADEAEAAVARRSEKGKEILIEDDVDEEHSKRQSLSLLFHEDKAIEKEITNLSRNKSGASSEASKLDTSSLVASDVKAPETFEVQNRNDLEVKIPKDSDVKTPETPKAKEAKDQEFNFSENWEVKFPEELEDTKTSEVVKVSKELKLPQVSKFSAPELSQVKVTKETDVLEDLEDKNVPKVMTDEVKAAESELLKVSEVTTSEDLDIEVPKVFEVKTPETLSVGSEIKIDQDATKVKTTEETKISEFEDGC